MPKIGERIGSAVTAGIMGVFICFFSCLEMSTFVGSITAFVVVPTTLAIFGLLAGDKLIKFLGRMARWL